MTGANTDYCRNNKGVPPQHGCRNQQNVWGYKVMAVNLCIQRTQKRMDIQITEHALARIKQAAKTEGVDINQAMLRVAVSPGGCSGLTYDLGWDTTFQENDSITEMAGIRVVIDARSHLYLEGSTLDFSEGLEGKGFHFFNPQATRTCACGESFGM